MCISKNNFCKTRCIYFSKKDGKFLENYDEVWETVSNTIKKKINSEPVHNKKYLKAEKKNQSKRRLAM